MKKALVLFAALLCFAFVTVDALAHAGKTDANGGHYDYSTGQYHYHHGYEAHQHRNGICPYDFDDRTGRNSGKSGGSYSSWAYTSAPRPTNQVPLRKNTQIDVGTKENHSGIICLCLGVCAVVAIGMVCHIKNENDKKQEEEQKRKKQKEINYYLSSDLRTLSGMPDEYYVDANNVPYEKNKTDEYTYGKTIDVYISTSSSSHVYHRKECRYAKYARLSNVFSDDKTYKTLSRSPCSYCNPDLLPDGKWYAEYTYHANKCKWLGIEPIREPYQAKPPEYISRRR